jgi:2-haloacid dehalogenase
MFGWGGSRRPRVIAFDVIGTVFPLEALRPAIVGLGLPPAGLEGWFAAALRDAFALSAAGDFEPFTTVLRGALDQVLAEQRLSPSASARAKLMAQFTHLPARPDARQAFETARRAGLRVMALSNGASAATWSLLKGSYLDGLVEHVVSVEDVQVFKPRREVYEHAARVAGVKARRLALVAAHPWDVNGAKAAGLTAAYVSAERPLSSGMRLPDVEAPSLAAAVRALVAL